jgi:spermidine synthase
MRALSLVVAALLMAAPASAQTTIAQERSIYRDIVIYETGFWRCMKFGLFHSPAQSCRALRDADELVLPYSRMLMAALYLEPAPKRILMIGLGGGTVARALRQAVPEAAIDLVELDPAVIRVARAHFGFDPAQYASVVAEDGRVFVRRAGREGRRYDLIVLDAFDHAYVPEHMMTREFFAETKALLTETGVLAANSFATSRLYHSESATYAAALGPFYNLADQNRIILFRNAGLPAMAAVRANAARLDPVLRPMGVEAERMLALFRADTTWPEGTRVLTDQYAPANLLNRR